MPRSLDLYLQDMLQAGRDIQLFTESKTLQDYQSDRLLRAGVERFFEIIGEALTQVRKFHPDERPVSAAQQRIIEFRNRIIHGYFGVNDEVVWSAAKVYLPVFLDEVSALADRREQDRLTTPEPPEQGTAPERLS